MVRVATEISGFEKRIREWKIVEQLGAGFSDEELLFELDSLVSARGADVVRMTLAGDILLRCTADTTRKAVTA